LLTKGKWTAVHESISRGDTHMTTAIEQRLPAAAWTVDTTHSTVGFALKYMVSTFRTGFDRFDVALDTTGDEPRLTGSVDPTSIAVRDENFHAHLQSPEFFDIEQYPELRFTAEDIRLDGYGKVSVAGELTIKGVTKPVTVTGTVTAPIVDPYGNERIGLNLTTKIDRTDFGVNWNNPLPNGDPSLANDVTILAELQFVKPGGETN